MGAARITQPGISIPLLPRRLEIGSYVRALRPHIEHAYELYLTADPKHGVQELGQVIENIMRNLAIQARKKGKLTKGADPADPKTSQANILEDLLTSRIIDGGVLGRCRAFVVDRNDTSHKPRSLKQALAIERNYKDNFNTGLRIMQDLPRALKEKGYVLRM